MGITKNPKTFSMRNTALLLVIFFFVGASQQGPIAEQLKVVAKKCMDGNNVKDPKIQGAVMGVIDKYVTARRQRMLRNNRKLYNIMDAVALAKSAACDSAVKSACAAASIPPVVCNCFRDDLARKCVSLIPVRN